MMHYQKRIGFFGAIQEKLDWTEEKPWLNHDQYVLWARVQYANYVTRRAKD
jgi:hypothetical protein